MHEAVSQRFSFSENGGKGGQDTESQSVSKEEDTYDFHAQVGKSILPHFIELAQKHSISLVFIRVQRRPTENGVQPDFKELAKYMEELQAYLASHDADFYDFSGDPELRLSAYNDGDHIKDAKIYTELFVRRLSHLLQ
jgi:hypothetical protein